MLYACIVQTDANQLGGAPDSPHKRGVLNDPGGARRWRCAHTASRARFDRAAEEKPGQLTDFSAILRTFLPYCFRSVWYRWAASGLAGLAQLGSVRRERIAIRMELTCQ